MKSKCRGAVCFIFVLWLKQAWLQGTLPQKGLPDNPDEPERSIHLYKRHTENSERETPNGQRSRRDLCGQTLTAVTGVVTSPNYPNNYDNNTDCTVTIQAPPDRIIEIVIDDLEIDYNRFTRGPTDPDFPAGIRCYKDYLELEDVGVARSKYCGIFTYRKWTSFSNQVKVHFHSNQDNARRGFSSTYNILRKPADGVMMKFGVSEGDIVLPTEDDLTQEFNFQYDFFGTHYDSFWVNSNGVVSFNGPQSGFLLQPLPLTSGNNPLIAPYWADVDLRSGGQLLIRETEDVDFLADVSQVIATTFHNDFEATSAIVVTWYDVAFFGTSKQGQAVRNTFQLILTKNSSNCGHAIFNFHEILWTTAGNTLYPVSDDDTGLTDVGIEAEFGFDAGDATRYFSHPDSRSIRIRNVDIGSNIGLPGRWVAIVCGEEINNCSYGNGNCEQICNVGEDGLSTCSCQEGYETNGGTCTSIDACATNNGGCDQVCINIGLAQRICDCKQGYQLNADGTTCDEVEMGSTLTICRKYTMHSDQLTWADAKTRCADRNMALADVRAQSINVALVNLLENLASSSSSFWFGVHRVGGGGWMTAHEKDVCYENWASSEEKTASDGENCARFWSESQAAWTSERCEKTMGFICQY